MKQIPVILMILGVTSCASRVEIPAVSIIQYTPPALTGREQHVFKEIMPRLAASLQRVGTRGGKSILPRSLEESRITAIPYYMLDVDSFLARPSMDSLQDHARLVPDKMYYMVMQDEAIKLCCVARQQQDSTWDLQEMIYGQEDLLAWLPARLARDNARDFRWLEVLGRPYVWYYRDGQPVLCMPSGIENVDFIASLAARKRQSDRDAIFWERLVKHPRFARETREKRAVSAVVMDSIVRSMTDSL
jgi:hypothetical protein